MKRANARTAEKKNDKGFGFNDLVSYIYDILPYN